MNNKVFKENLTSKLLKIESLKILNKLKKKMFVKLDVVVGVFLIT